MAKKNVVHLLGYIEDIVEEINDRLFFTIKIRKNPNKCIHPIIEISKKMHPNWQQIQRGKLLMLEGSIKTEPKEQEIICPNCGRINIEKYIFTTVLAQKMFILEPTPDEMYMNNVVLLGVVCKEQEFKYIPGTSSDVANMKYLLAVNRRQPQLSDYPWISTFANQAQEDAKRLNVGSQILVEGVLNTRYAAKNIYCEACGESINISEPQTEVMGVSVEYLNNCNFPENDE